MCARRVRRGTGRERRDGASGARTRRTCSSACRLRGRTGSGAGLHRCQETNAGLSASSMKTCELQQSRSGRSGLDRVEHRGMVNELRDEREEQVRLVPKVASQKAHVRPVCATCLLAHRARDARRSSGCPPASEAALGPGWSGCLGAAVRPLVATGPLLGTVYRCARGACASAPHSWPMGTGLWLLLVTSRVGAAAPGGRLARYRMSGAAASQAGPVDGQAQHCLGSHVAAMPGGAVGIPIGSPVTCGVSPRPQLESADPSRSLIGVRPARARPPTRQRGGPLRSRRR